ncbi:MAG: hypothetical protein KKA19_00590 [Candidatus Margulisbacteria bacterium]|nr:hypothetical protein [Candidatus Margulisiibacteriota bacterium]
MSKIELVPYENHFFESYQQFAWRNWGKGTYKADQNYLNWLYKENPSVNKSKMDFLIATVDGKDVVGSIHKMRAFWRINNEEVEIPAIHNLLVDKKYQSGYGLFLITSSLKGHEHIFVPAVADPISEVYEKLHCQRLDVFWYRKVLNPVAATTGYLLNKHFKMITHKKYFNEKWQIKSPEFKVTINPSFEILSKIVKTLRKRNSGYNVHPAWDEVWLKWRFFHKIGPKHLLIFSERGEDLDFLILSLGPRHGLNTCRIIEASVENSALMKKMLKAIEKMLKKNGIQLFLVFTADPKLNNNLVQNGWQPLKNTPKTFIYHKNKKEQFSNYAFNALVGDFGLESIEK